MLVSEIWDKTPCDPPDASERFKFTPIATSKKAPRLWDRRPSTPFIPRSKSHKVWKRFLVDVSGDIGIDDSILDHQNDYDHFLTEINRSAELAALRGVKRLRVGSGTNDEEFRPGRSFLETKWEAEKFARRRKHASRSNKQRIETSGVCSAIENERREGLKYTPEGLNNIQRNKISSSAHPCRLPDAPTGSRDESTQNLDNKKDVGGCAAVLSLDLNHGGNIQSPENALNVQAGSRTDIESIHKTAFPMGSFDSAGECLISFTTSTNGEQHESEYAATKIKDVGENTASLAAASILRVPTLEGDDAELLSDFLTRAKAKRAAALSAMKCKDPEIPLKPDALPRSPLSGSRRALEDLDKNSPSSPRLQSSPSRSGLITASPLSRSPYQNVEEKGEPVEQDQLPQNSTPYRRSPRTGTPKPQRFTPAVPNHIPVRRSDGTEFVFLQRSEAQQLALTTRANTKRNKGSAQLPYLVLQSINAKLAENLSGMDEQAGDPISSPKPPAKRLRGVKQVTWNEQQLVRYEGERLCETEPEAGRERSSSKRALSEAAKKGKHNPSNPRTTKLTAPSRLHSHIPRSPAATQKLANLATSGPHVIATIHPTVSGSTKTQVKMATTTSATPLNGRKKLAPKSQRDLSTKLAKDPKPNNSSSSLRSNVLTSIKPKGRVKT